MRRRALVVEDEVILATLIKDVLVAGGFEVEVAHTAPAGSKAFELFDPDVAVLDISLGRGVSGLDLAHLASTSYPGVALLLLTRYPDLRTARIKPSELPANCGFLSKGEVKDSAVLLNAVEAALRDSQRPGREKSDASGPLSNLTRTQIEVLHLLAQGYSTSEIARRRGRSISAIEKMLTSIYQRLNIDTASQLHARVEAARIYSSVAVLPDRSEPDEIL